MRHHRSQKGSSLILLIGIVAALAGLVVALVALSGNVQSNTHDEALRVTAFNAAEAAVDSTMQELGNSWPAASPTPVKSFVAWSSRTVTTAAPTPVATGFVNRLKSQGVNWPSPPAGRQAVNVWARDNVEASSSFPTGYSATNPPPYDANGDGMMYVIAQTEVGDQRVRIQLEVIRSAGGIDFPRGVDLWLGGNLIDNGLNYTDNNLKVSDVALPLDKTATSGPTAIHAYLKGTLTLGAGTVPPDYDNLSDYPPVVTLPTDAEWKELEAIFPQSLVQRVVAAAKAQGTYYTAASGPGGPPAGSMAGFLVVDPSDGGTKVVPPGTTVNLSSGATVNTLLNPGVLLVLGGPNVTTTMTGGSTYYGLFYTSGNFTSNVAGDSPHIRGAVFIEGNCTFAGKDHFYYHDNCIKNLGLQFSLTCKAIPGTWRELTPK